MKSPATGVTRSTVPRPNTLCSTASPGWKAAPAAFVRAALPALMEELCPNVCAGRGAAVYPVPDGRGRPVPGCAPYPPLAAPPPPPPMPPGWRLYSGFKYGPARCWLW